MQKSDDGEFTSSRAFWKRWTGYHARSRIEAQMRCLKSSGKRTIARQPDRQTAGIYTRIALVTAEIIRMA